MNNYHIYEQQAKGKYSVIFKARKKKKLEFVAIKRLQKTRKAKVYNEAKILSQLDNHQNIIKFYDFMETKNHMWQITEYCPGGDLLKIIQYDKQLPQHTVRSFVLQIMAGMQYAHSKGIIICDIKPASILVNQYGSVKIGDFGSAQKLVDLMGKAKCKKKGTPSYMAPQLFQVSGVYSFQSDLWALGCMMYELGQGNPPFVSTNFQQIAQLAKLASTPKIDTFSSDFNNLLCGLLQKDPQSRIIWKQIISHPWIKNELQQIDIPVQNHFLQYIRQRSKHKNEQLRVSHNFENQNYENLENLKANDRRQLFEFQTYGQEQNDDEQNEYLEQQQKMQQMQGEIRNLNVNMLKNKKVQINVKQKNYSNTKNTIEQNPFSKQNKNKIVNPIEDSSNINLFLQTLTSKPSIPLQQAINHQSDTAVKPIIGNKDIEVIESINFNKKQLGFSYIEPQILAEGIVNNQMDEQLKKILDGMKSEEKVNVLGYFETIVQNSEVANYLFKSNFIPYYMSLLKSYKQSSLRSKICQILGLLIRHATSIDSEILKYGIISGFVQAVTKDKSEKVRRKAMAALGQLLFYGATQVDEDAMQWDIPLSLISTLLKILKNTGEDELVRIYCCKSIQNITAQAQKVGLNFSQIDTLIVMIGCYNSTKNEGFKTSVMSCIHHMITLNQTLRQIFLQKMPISTIITTFQDPEVSSKNLQIILWIFLQQLLKSPKSKQSRLLMQSKDMIKGIFSVMENGSSVVKGRVYLFIFYLLTFDFKKIQLISESKLFHSIEKHGKQTGKFESQALQFVVAILHQNFPYLLKLCTQQLQASIVNPLSAGQKNVYITIISQMQSCSVYEEIFSNQETVQSLLNLFNLIQAKSSSGQRPYLEHFKNQYFMILQKVFTNQSTTEKLQQMYCASVLPFLIGKMLKTTQNDIRYSCVKYIIYLINFCLSEQFLYDSTILTSTSSKISSLIISHLIPQLDILFEQGEVVSNMMFKLMAEIFNNRLLFIQKFWQSCKIQKLLQYFSQNATVNVLRTIQYLFSYKLNLANQQKAENQQKMEKVIYQYLLSSIDLLSVYVNSGQELFLQYPLSIITNIITNSDIKPQKSEINHIFENVVSLQSRQDNLVRNKAETLIELILSKSMYSQKGLDQWKNLSKKGIENYQLYTRISGLKAKVKPTEGFRTQKQSRYN